MNYRKSTRRFRQMPLLLPAFALLTVTACGGYQPVTPSDADKLAHEVVIRRTDFGVPHIYADNLQAAGYALAYAQMEDHAARVIESLLQARGEWAQHVDLEGDELQLTIGRDALSKLAYRRAVETWPQLSTDTQQFLTGFAIGINRYVDLHAGELTTVTRPWFTAYDAHARGIVRPGQRSVREFLKANPQISGTQFVTGIADEMTEPPVMAKSWNTSDVGSNAWAIAPGRTKSGHAILLRNPHLNWDAGYYEAHIKVPGQFDFYGDFRVGHALGIIGGFNERLGWATTNNAPDLDDIYSFALVPGELNQYLLDGNVQRLQRERLTIQYLANGEMRSTERSYWSTPYGPVIGRTDERVYITKSGGDGEFRTGEQFLRMMQAQSFNEWQDAMRMRAKATSNLTYADADGNIFYVWNASIPARPHAPLANGDALPVMRSDEMWQDIVPWEQMPQLLNPPGGYLHNENDPFHFASLEAVLQPGDFPPYFPEPRLRLRSQLALQLIANDKRLSLRDVLLLKHSMRMLLADRVKDDLVAAIAATAPHGDEADALELLVAWDNNSRRDSRGAVLFEAWWNRYLETAGNETPEPVAASAGFSVLPEYLFREPWSFEKATTTPRGLADPLRAVEAFVWAVNETREKYGHWNVAWGDVHRAQIGSVNVPVGGCPGILGCFRTFWFNDVANDHAPAERLVRGGDGWILAVEFGEAPRAYSILAYGESSKEDSPHSNDQLEKFANNEMKPVAYTDTDVASQLLREYRPGLADEKP